MLNERNIVKIAFWLLFGGLVATSFLMFGTSVQAQSGVPFSVDIVAQVPGCGDGVIQAGEQCDAGNFGGASCSSLGFRSGTLACSSVCTHLTDACVLDTGVRGGGSSRSIPAPVSVVPQRSHIIVSGYSAPGIAVTLLKDGQAVGVAVPNEAGAFQITVAGVAAGNHLLQLVSTDFSGSFIRSVTMIVRVMPDATTKVSEVLLAPHVRLAVVTNEGVRVVGVGVPGSELSITAANGEFVTVSVGGDGAFDIQVPGAQGNITILISYLGGIVESGVITPQSEEESIPVTEQSSTCGRDTDLNQDCRVNLIDFMAMLRVYLYAPVVAQFDVDQNGSITLVDFSIMAYYWTG